MAAIEEMTSSERICREDIAGAAFQAGVDRGYWRLVAVVWPHAVIQIAAAARPGALAHYALRFDLTGYPEAPAAQFWDVSGAAPLPPPRWPGGGPRTAAAFNPAWNPSALYMPMDRVALQGHDAWRTQHPSHVWDPERDITQYLELVHELLNEESYRGLRG